MDGLTVGGGLWPPSPRQTSVVGSVAAGTSDRAAPASERAASQALCEAGLAGVSRLYCGLEPATSPVPPTYNLPARLPCQASLKRSPAATSCAEGRHEAMVDRCLDKRWHASASLVCPSTSNLPMTSPLPASSPIIVTRPSPPDLASGPPDP
ncbi:hypothetical protein CDD83_411 [Cordyceps sp. RAO-2017]|nr:hypothetical protein CDD83_411 [Cordyceps sp. RAO-2017]